MGNKESSNGTKGKESTATEKKVSTKNSKIEKKKVEKNSSQGKEPEIVENPKYEPKIEEIPKEEKVEEIANKKVKKRFLLWKIRKKTKTPKKKVKKTKKSASNDKIEKKSQPQQSPQKEIQADNIVPLTSSISSGIVENRSQPLQKEIQSENDVPVAGEENNEGVVGVEVTSIEKEEKSKKVPNKEPMIKIKEDKTTPKTPKAKRKSGGIWSKHVSSSNIHKKKKKVVEKEAQVSPAVKKVEEEPETILIKKKLKKKSRTKRMMNVQSPSNLLCTVFEIILLVYQPSSTLYFKLITLSKSHYYWLRNIRASLCCANITFSVREPPTPSEPLTFVSKIDLSLYKSRKSLRHRSFFSLMKNFPNVKNVTFPRIKSKSINNSTIRVLIEKYNIESIDLSDSASHISHASFRFPAVNDSLRKVVVNNCSGIDFSKAMTIFNRQCSKIRELHVSGIRNDNYVDNLPWDEDEEDLKNIFLDHQKRMEQEEEEKKLAKKKQQREKSKPQEVVATEEKDEVVEKAEDVQVPTPEKGDKEKPPEPVEEKMEVVNEPKHVVEENSKKTEPETLGVKEEEKKTKKKMKKRFLFWKLKRKGKKKKKGETEPEPVVVVEEKTTSKPQEKNQPQPKKQEEGNISISNNPQPQTSGAEKSKPEKEQQQPLPEPKVIEAQQPTTKKIEEKEEEEEVEEVVPPRYLGNVRTLYFSHVMFELSPGFFKTFEVNLTELNVEGNFYVDNKSIRMIFTRFKKLSTLILKDCDRIKHLPILLPPPPPSDQPELSSTNPIQNEIKVDKENKLTIKPKPEEVPSKHKEEEEEEEEEKKKKPISMKLKLKYLDLSNLSHLSKPKPVRIKKRPRTKKKVTKPVKKEVRTTTTTTSKKKKKKKNVESSKSTTNSKPKQEEPIKKIEEEEEEEEEEILPPHTAEIKEHNMVKFFRLSVDTQFLKRLDLENHFYSCQTSNGNQGGGEEESTNNNNNNTSKLAVLPTLVADIGLPNLVRANFRGCGIGDSELLLLAQGCPALKMLYLKKNKKLTDKSLQHLSKIRILRLLEISDCQKITDRGLRNLAQSCPSLYFLDISLLMRVTDDGMEFLSQMGGLETLNLDCVSSVTNEGLRKLLMIRKPNKVKKTKKKKKQKKMKKIIVEEVKKIETTLQEEEEEEEPIQPTNKNGCHGVNDNGLRVIGKYAIRIKRLKIGFNYQISNEGVNSHLKKLKRLDVRNCSRLHRHGQDGLEEYCVKNDIHVIYK